MSCTPTHGSKTSKLDGEHRSHVLCHVSELKQNSCCLDVFEACGFACDSAVALLVSGQVLLAQGDPKEARILLSKALKLAHSKLINHHLVSQASSLPFVRLDYCLIC